MFIYTLANPIQIKQVGIVLAIVATLAVVFGALILIVTKVFKVKEDEKVLKILENLAGANCGGCGHSGCASFAKAVAEGKAQLSECNATSAESKKVICSILGEEFKDEVPTVAVVKCLGGINSADKYEYVGNEGCINQVILLGGRKLCSTACLGGGTCEKLCPVNAIKLVDEVAVIDKSLCISCGACINKCPKAIIERIPVTAPVYCACSTQCRGKETTSFCKKGCIGCGLCAKNCPNGAITMVNNLPAFDYTKCNGCLTCVSKCPRKIIIKH